MTKTDAIGEFMEMIHAAAAPVIERQRMTDDQAANYMLAIFDRVIAEMATEHPDVSERLLAAFAHQLNG